MNSSFSQMKSYCSFSIRLNRLKKRAGTTKYKFFIFFPNLHSNCFFLSLHSVLSLLCSLFSLLSVLSSFSAEARNGLGLVCGWKRRRGSGYGVVVDWACNLSHHQGETHGVALFSDL
jgi:hypothetical protein